MIHSASIRHHPLHVTPATSLVSSTWAQAYVSGPNLVCAVNSILQALASLILSIPLLNLSSANLGLQSQWQRWCSRCSLTKSKQFVSIKKCLSQVLQWNRNAWWAPPGPRPTEKFEVVLPFVNDGVQTPLHGQSGQLNCEKPQLSRIGTLHHHIPHSVPSIFFRRRSAYYPPSLTSQSTSTVSSVSTSNLVSSARAQDCM